MIRTTRVLIQSKIGMCTSMSPENCDKSCIVDSDCDNTCYCGIINKDETCRRGNILVDCGFQMPQETACINNVCTLKS